MDFIWYSILEVFYLENLLSEGFHTWTIGTLGGVEFHFMASDLWVHARGLGLEVKN